MTEEEKTKFLRSLPAKASVGEIAVMWVVVALCYKLTPEELGACIEACGRALLDGRYEAQLLNREEVRH